LKTHNHILKKLNYRCNEFELKITQVYFAGITQHFLLFYLMLRRYDLTPDNKLSIIDIFADGALWPGICGLNDVQSLIHTARNKEEMENVIANIH